MTIELTEEHFNIWGESLAIDKASLNLKKIFEEKYIIEDFEGKIVVYSINPKGSRFDIEVFYVKS